MILGYVCPKSPNSSPLTIDRFGIFGAPKLRVSKLHILWQFQFCIRWRSTIFGKRKLVHVTLQWRQYLLERNTWMRLSTSKNRREWAFFIWTLSHLSNEEKPIKGLQRQASSNHLNAYLCLNFQYEYRGADMKWLSKMRYEQRQSNIVGTSTISM